MLQVSFLTFGGPKIGMGHIYRCLALTKWTSAAQGDVRFSFTISPDDPADNGAGAYERVREAGFEDVRLSDGNDLPTSPDVIIIDRLQVPAPQVETLRRSARMVVSVDDAGPGALIADVALNPLYRNPALAHAARAGTHIERRGPAWQVLDPVFSELATAPADTARSVLLLQGSSDPHGLLPRLLSDLAPVLAHHPETCLHVLAGRVASRTSLLAAALVAYPHRLEVHDYVEDLPRLQSQMDVAVSGAGVSAFELAALGVPTILVTGEEKELETAAALDAQGIAIDAGQYGETARAKLIAAFSALMNSPSEREALNERARSLVDGKAGERVWQMIRESSERRHC